MNNIKWIKISCDLFDDEVIKVIEKMPEADSIIVIWLKLLISAGKTNDKGFVYFKKEIPYTDEMLSAVFNRPLNTIRLAIKTFEIDYETIHINITSLCWGCYCPSAFFAYKIKIRCHIVLLF